jgi:hypothetical protein
MKRINQRQAVEAIRNKEEFKAGALVGGCPSAASQYVVKSYDVILATFLWVSGKWYVDNQRYSVTTSRHQSIVRQAIGEV